MTKALLHYSELQPKPLVCVRSKGKNNTFDGAGWKIHDIWASNWTYTGQQGSHPVTWGILNHFIRHFLFFKAISVTFDGGMLKKHMLTQLNVLSQTCQVQRKLQHTPRPHCQDYVHQLMVLLPIIQKWRMCYADVHKQCTSIYMGVYLLT